MDPLNSHRFTFGKESIHTALDLGGRYFEPTDDGRCPAVDSLSSQGMFQFTVAADHVIRGVDVLRTLCSLYGSEPKLYFVVPSHRFAKFRKQPFMRTKGAKELKPIPKLKQYVLELPVTRGICEERGWAVTPGIYLNPTDPL